MMQDLWPLCPTCSSRCTSGVFIEDNGFVLVLRYWCNTCNFRDPEEYEPA